VSPEEVAVPCQRSEETIRQGGTRAAILRVDVPDEIIALATDEVYFPLSQGLVQFDEGAGLEELRAAWSSLTKAIELLQGP
jgi:hypothetical protein